ncbi:hypothetical protein B0H10DRAFT_2115161 [Mycena sp. CBHHK59/15]|nr:hypothetical protein B0H10DRAFT_2115161 [Mycena sp. CBHHK59/15]
MTSSRSTSPSTASPASDIDELRKHTEYLKWTLSARQRRQEEGRQQQAQRNAVKTKHGQWKAASARYYENHPEVREKKRLKMAEQRAAKKAARRRWDPPKKVRVPKPAADISLDEASEHSESEQLQTREAVAVVSLLFLQQRTNPNPFPADLPPSSDPGTSDDEEDSRAHSRNRRGKLSAGKLARSRS